MNRTNHFLSTSRTALILLLATLLNAAAAQGAWAWEGSAAWYTLDGRKLQAQPTKSGLYIHGGRKVAIK